MHTVNPVLFRIVPHTLPRSQSLQSFGDYRDSESASSSSNKPGVAEDGTPLEYETLELRIHPPNVEVDNETWDDMTLITVDSANRPGTLVEVIQCLTELGLDIRTARISSDGGWFVDQFWVSEHTGGQVADLQKLNAIRKVLNVEIDREAVTRDHHDSCSLFEIAARDDPGVLAEVVNLLQQNGCDIKSLAAWTYYSRAALVVSISEGGQAIQDKAKLQRLRQLLVKKVKSEFGDPCIRLYEKVVGPIHHERRLHQLLLAEEGKAWVRYQNASRAPSALPLMPPQTPTLKPRPHQIRTGSMPCLEAALTNALLAAAPPSRPPMPPSPAPPVPAPTTSLLRENSCSSNGSSGGTPTTPHRQKLDVPEIEIRKTPLPYWLVTIKCRDRTKLAFDTVCTLADMSYDVYHAAIDTEDQVATQVFYVKSRNGDQGWEEEAVERLKYMLRAAVQRRFPGGLKVHMLATDTSCIVDIAREFMENNINIARVKVFVTEEGTCVSMYLMDKHNVVPDLSLVANTCENLGGQYLVLQDEGPIAGWDRRMQQEEDITDTYRPAVTPPGWMAPGAGPPAIPDPRFIHVSSSASNSASPSATRPAPISMAKRQLRAQRDSSKRFSFTFSYIDKKWEGG